MFLKSCKGRKSCLDPIPNVFMIFENLQQRFFSSSSSWFYFFSRPDATPSFLSLFIVLRPSHRHRLRRSKVTDNESKYFLKSSKNPKSQKPQKSIIQKRPILALFDPPYIGQYVPVSAMELKWSFLRGPAHKIEKRPFFAKKREVEEKKKGFEVSTCFAIIIYTPTRASDPLLIQ